LSNIFLNNNNSNSNNNNSKKNEQEVVLQGSFSQEVEIFLIENYGLNKNYFEISSALNNAKNKKK
jgi:hypothetical protein